MWIGYLFRLKIRKMPARIKHFSQIVPAVWMTLILAPKLGTWSSPAGQCRRMAFTGSKLILKMLPAMNSGITSRLTRLLWLPRLSPKSPKPGLGEKEEERVIHRINFTLNFLCYDYGYG